jgi:predicted Zn-dependent peptidase
MVGGDDEQLAKIELGDVCRFMRDHYVPERVTVIVAGKLDETAAGRSSGARWASCPPGAARRGRRCPR